MSMSIFSAVAAATQLGSFGSVISAFGLGVQIGQKHLGEDFDDEGLKCRGGGAHDGDVDFDAGPDGYGDAHDFFFFRCDLLAHVPLGKKQRRLPGNNTKGKKQTYQTAPPPAPPQSAAATTVARYS